MALTLLQPFNLDPNGNYTFANANLTGNVNASYFIGNGSQLTGIAGGNVTTSATPPVSPSEGDWWINNNTATMYVYFNDGTSNQWAEMEAYQAISSTTANATVLANGNSNINIATSGGNVDISVAGNSNVVSISGTTVLVAGNINPAANVTYNLGNASYRWNNLFLAGNTIDLGGAVIQATSNAIVFTNPEGGNFTVEGNTATNTAAIINGTSNVAIDIANGNVTFGVNGTNNAVVISDSTISGPNNITSNYFTGRVYGAANTVANSTQSNITSVGTLTSLNVSGNITAPNIIANSGTFIGNGIGLTFIAGGNVSGAVSYASTANSVAGANVSGAVAYATVANSVAAANIVGTVSDSANANVANTAGTVTTNAQPNITSVGTLSSLTVTGNITSGNVYANSGTIGASLIAGTLTTASQPNVTSLGTLSSLTVTGNTQVNGNVVSDNVISRTGTLTLSAIGSNQDIDLKPSGNGTVDVWTARISNVAAPVDANDAATKDYVDSVATGLHVHDSCYVATTGTLDSATSGTVTYNNGSNGVGATLTTTGTYTTIDGGNVQTVGTRILVKNESNAAWNGIYTYTNTTVITRSADFNTSSEAAGGDFVFITSGSTQADTGWVQTTDNPTLGTSNIVWTQFAGAGTYTAGTGLTLTGTTFSVSNTTVTAASYGNGDRVASFTVNSQGQLTAASNVVIAANAANLTGTTLAATIVNSSLTSLGTLSSLSVSGNGTFGNILGPYANGNSNVNIPSANGNVNISAVGNANIFVVTGTGVNVAGTLNATGNITGNYFIGNGSQLTGVNTNNPIAYAWFLS